MKKIIGVFFIGCIFTVKSVAQKSWTAADRGPFIEECVKAAKSGMSEDSAKYYCYCMLEKVEEKYPDPAEAGKLDESAFNSPEWKKIIAGCLGGYWNNKDRNDFMSSCTEVAKASIGEEKAKAYCECMMYKIENRYPVYADATKITAEQLQSPDWKKIIQSCLQ